MQRFRYTNNKKPDSIVSKCMFEVVNLAVRTRSANELINGALSSFGCFERLDTLEREEIQGEVQYFLSSKMSTTADTVPKL